jgi:hypothetical protein
MLQLHYKDQKFCWEITAVHFDKYMMHTNTLHGQKVTAGATYMYFKKLMRRGELLATQMQVLPGSRVGGQV